MPVFSFQRRKRPVRRTIPIPDATDVRRLEIRARKLMENRALGAYDSVFRGHGVEFAEVRAYQPGDPFQAIDWKVTARMGRPFVKRFVEERELSVLIAVDVSGSLETGTRGNTKRQLALEVAALLGLAATRNNDRVGLLLFSDRLERWIRPRRGRGRLRQLLHVLVTQVPAGRGTDLGLAFRTLVRALNTRSLVFVISDFRDADFHRELAVAGKKHDVVGIQLDDLSERKPPPAGIVEVVDPETGRTGLIDLASAGVREEIERTAAEREARLAEMFMRAGCDRVVLRTDQSFAADLASFFAKRARARLH
ncbi:MAG: DUF58 domain-containing protein [marine benthic group bacterium]|jgi:uncharacterized protein (DUF58 family)|nr:DUF58 domain-containing protein [Gemmatimonadota bacterium]MCL7962849.1 DUF58 domain-containing protein [Candidatus Carthagonibacter metallireducens]MCL7956866.1 DUF58 domain-containing protein [Gemmatimonadota bacterium]MCL7964658.1 DUF58 domain-containing protein [Gemmatimonadota bacterium]MCL7967796.1 DUF58 domain-containing protein [Gemmatimonadota bacterium]